MANRVGKEKLRLRVLFWMFIGFDQHATSEHLLSAIIKRLCEAGHSVHIIQKNTGGSLPVIPEQLKGYKITTDEIPYRAANKGNFIARYLTELKYIKDCKRHITSDYDAVFIQSNNVAGFAVKAIRKKLPGSIVTFNVQDVFPYNAMFSGTIKQYGLVFKVLERIQKSGYKHSDHVITISEDMKETLIVDGLAEDKVDVVYNWSYQDELYENVDLSPVSYMFNPNMFNVVYAGNIGVMQNVDILIETAKLMKEDKSVWFHIIGNGVNKDRIEKVAREYAIKNISFWPMQPPNLAPLIYSAADVNVIPLAKDIYRTALPSKTATCMACQKPIIFAIGKDSKFGKKVMEEAGCQVVEADKAEELAEAIKKVQNGKRENKSGEFFLKYCGTTENSRKYAKIIAGQK